MNMKKVKITNLFIDNVSMNELLKELNNGVVFTPNVDHIMSLQKDKEFYEIYKSADYVVCDSKIIQIISKFLKTPITEKISGSDLFPAFYKYHRKNEKITIFLLGAADGVAAIAAKKINLIVGRDIVKESHSPSFNFFTDEGEITEIIEKINKSKVSVLAVGVGSPKQEKWIIKYKSRMPYVKIFLAIGATIDFEAGNIKRAPLWMQHSGFEWLYRLLREPKRLFKRYIVDDFPFFLLVIKQKFKLYKNPFK